MMLTQLLTSSENLYKYVLVCGVGLLILSVFYPIERKYSLKEKINAVNKEIALLNHEIQILEKEANDLVATFPSDGALNNLKRKPKEYEEFKEKWGGKVDRVDSNRKYIGIHKIQIEFDKEGVRQIKEQINEFKAYQIAFIVLGLFLSIFGFVGWYKIMKKAP